MNKKGFTLIELLAVIVILAIIALIATPIILNIISDARESANERSVELYATAVKNAIMKKKIDEPKAEINGSFTQTNEGRTLTSQDGSVVLTVEYDGDVQCSEAEVRDNYKLKLEGCKVNGSNSSYSYDEENGATNDGTVTSPSEPEDDSGEIGGSDNPTGGQEPDVKVNYFDQDSWATIISNVQNGNTSRYNVGDTKSITLTSDDKDIAGTYTVRIANKSTPSECSTAGFSQTACGFVIEFADIITLTPMSTKVNAGMWPATSMRTYVNDNIYNAFPSELKAEIIDTLVVSGVEEEEIINTDSGRYIQESTDKLYLLSSSEIWVDEAYSEIEHDTARYLTRNLDYYGVVDWGDQRTLKKYNGDYSYWWFRSATTESGYGFHASNGVMGWYYYDANNSYGVSPAFRIGKK